MAMVTGICNGCGATIVWVTIQSQLDNAGKHVKVPLDPKPAVYYIEGQNGDGYIGRRANGNKDRAMGQAMVSHFVTCPKAAEFSGRNRG